MERARNGRSLHCANFTTPLALTHKRYIDIDSVVRVDQGRDNKDLHFCRASYAGHPFQNTRKTNLRLLTLRFRHPRRREAETLADVGKRLPFFEFLLAYGPQDQTHPPNRHPQSHRHRVQQQEARSTVKKEVKIASVQLRQPGQEILLSEYQQPRPVELLQLSSSPKPLRLASDLLILVVAEPHRQLLAYLPHKNQHRRLQTPLLNKPIQQQHPLEAHAIRPQFSIATLRMTHSSLYHNVTPSISHRRHARCPRIASCLPASGGISSSRIATPSVRSRWKLSAFRRVSRLLALRARFSRLLSSGHPTGTAGIFRGRRRS